MKKMLLKNWFYVLLILILGIKYGTAQECRAQEKDFSIGWNGGANIGNSGLNIGGSNGLSIGYKGVTFFYSTGAYLTNLVSDDILKYIEGTSTKLITGGTYTRLGFSIDITKSKKWTPRLGVGTILDDKITTNPSTNDSSTLIYMQPGLTLDLGNTWYVSLDYNIVGDDMNQALFGVGIRL